MSATPDHTNQKPADAVGAAAASPSWRLRLNKTKPAQKRAGPAEAADTRDQFRSVAPGDTNRKSRKGYRPG